MTKKAAGKTTTSADGNNQFSLGTLGMDLLDTTWRIVVPVLIFTAAGIFADIQLGTKPWLTILAVVLGFVVAGLLIKRLLASVEKEDTK